MIEVPFDAEIMIEVNQEINMTTLQKTCNDWISNRLNVVVTAGGVEQSAVVKTFLNSQWPLLKPLRRII